MADSKTDKIMTIASKRGFFYPSAEIYGAKAGFWTYGHLGTRIKHGWEDMWREFFLGLDTNYFEIEDCNILPKQVFEGSGHLEHFNDPLTECSKCHFRFRADQLIEDAMKTNVGGVSAEDLTKIINDNKLLCPKCQSTLLPVKWFNMMFEMKVGATGEETMYLRPESAQSPYMAFKRELEALRRKIPMGLAVVGKAFRNEISPRQGFFRLREFTQAELQIFFDPDTINEAEHWNDVKDYKLRLFLHAEPNKGVQEVSCEHANVKLKIPKFYAYNMAKVQQFYLDLLNIPKERFRFRELSAEERAFYNKLHFDIELDMETLGGFKEVAGVHYRTDHDLGGHQKHSKETLEVVTPEGKRFIPHVLELSFGVDRNVWALMDIFYKEEKERTLFTFPAKIAPIEAAIFPLVNKDDIPAVAEEIYIKLRKELNTFWDDSGSVGRRYRRQDEVGTPYCVTIDYDSLKDNTVTIRDRDSMKQVRLKITDLLTTLKKLINSEIAFERAGKLLA